MVSWWCKSGQIRKAWQGQQMLWSLTLQLRIPDLRFSIYFSVRLLSGALYILPFFWVVILGLLIVYQAWFGGRLYQLQLLFYASVTSSHRPRTFFITHTISCPWGARRNFMSVLFSWSHQAMGSVWLDTAVHLWIGRIICRTPRVPRAMPIRASYGPHTGIFNVFHMGPWGTCKGAVRHPYGQVRELTKLELAKIRHGRLIWPYGTPMVPAQAVHGLFTISKRVRGL